MNRLLEAKNLIVGVPAGVTVLLSQIERAMPPSAGPATLGGMLLTAFCLWARLRHVEKMSDRQTWQIEKQAERTSKVAELNSEVERLRKQVAVLEDRNSLVIYTPPDTGNHQTVKSLSVLLAEDHEALGFTESKTLRKAGHRVRLVKTVAEAIREYNVEPPDAMVVDLKLADGDGEIILKHVRRSGLPCHVVIVTGEVDEARLSSVRKLGARVLVKPVNGDALLEAIRPDPTEPDPPVLPRSDSGIIPIPKP